LGWGEVVLRVQGAKLRPSIRKFVLAIAITPRLQPGVTHAQGILSCFNPDTDWKIRKTATGLKLFSPGELTVNMKKWTADVLFPKAKKIGL
jgi:hypothetical protein